MASGAACEGAEDVYVLAWPRMEKGSPAGVPVPSSRLCGVGLEGHNPVFRLHGVARQGRLEPCRICVKCVGVPCLMWFSVYRPLGVFFTWRVKHQPSSEAFSAGG